MRSFKISRAALAVLGVALFIGVVALARGGFQSALAQSAPGTGGSGNSVTNGELKDDTVKGETKLTINDPTKPTEVKLLELKCAEGTAMFGAVCVAQIVCANGGSLIANAAGGSCTCPAGFSGRTCEVRNQPSLRFITQPNIGSFPGVPFSTSPVVSVLRPDGTIDTTATPSITLSIKPGSGAAGAVLSSPSFSLTRAAAVGLATFLGLQIDRGGTGYVLVASATGFTSAESAPFTIGTIPTVTFSLKMNMDINTVNKDTAVFVSSFKESTATALGIKSSRITVTNVIAGSHLFPGGPGVRADGSSDIALRLEPVPAPRTLSSAATTDTSAIVLQAFSLTAADPNGTTAQPAKPVEVTLPVTPEVFASAGGKYTNLVLAQYDETMKVWTPVTQTSHTTDSVTFSVRHFSDFVYAVIPAVEQPAQTQAPGGTGGTGTTAPPPAVAPRPANTGTGLVAASSNGAPVVLVLVALLGASVVWGSLKLLRED